MRKYEIFLDGPNAGRALFLGAPVLADILVFQDGPSYSDIGIWDLPLKYFLDLRSGTRLVIDSSVGETMAVKPLSVTSALVVGSSISATRKIATTSVSSVLSIVPGVKDAKLSYTSATNRILLDSSLSVSFLATTAAGDKLRIESGVQDIDVRNSAGRMADALVVTSTVGNTRAQKYLRLPGELLLGSRCVPVIDNIFRAGSSLSITSTCAVTTRRARLLGEVDSLVMTEIDEMTLDDLDWVILED